MLLGTSTPGPSTSYTIYVGRIFGELHQDGPRHAVITDIEHAPRTRGKLLAQATASNVLFGYPATASDTVLANSLRANPNAMALTATGRLQ